MFLRYFLMIFIVSCTFQEEGSEPSDLEFSNFEDLLLTDRYVIETDSNLFSIKNRTVSGRTLESYTFNSDSILINYTFYNVANGEPRWVGIYERGELIHAEGKPLYVGSESFGGASEKQESAPIYLYMAEPPLRQAAYKIVSKQSTKPIEEIRSHEVNRGRNALLRGLKKGEDYKIIYTLKTSRDNVFSVDSIEFKR